MMLFEALVDLGLGPEVAHAVLHPLEVAGGDAAGVGEDVGNDEDLLVGEDLVGDGRGRAVGAFAEDLAAERSALLAGDHVLGRGGNQDLAVVGEKLVLVDGFGAGETDDGAGCAAVLDQGVDVDAVGVVEAAVVLGDADDLVALLAREAWRRSSRRCRSPGR